MSTLLSSGLSRARPSVRLVPGKVPWKQPVRYISLLGEETVPLAFDKIETSRTHNVHNDGHSKHTGAIVFVHGLL